MPILISMSDSCITCKQFIESKLNKHLYGCGIYSYSDVTIKIPSIFREEYAKSCICQDCFVKPICIDRCKQRREQWINLVNTFHL